MQRSFDLNILSYGQTMCIVGAGDMSADVDDTFGGSCCAARNANCVSRTVNCKSASAPSAGHIRVTCRKSFLRKRFLKSSDGRLVRSPRTLRRHRFVHHLCTSVLYVLAEQLHYCSVYVC